MLIFVVDDELRPLRLLHQAVREASPEARIRDFTRGGQVLQAIGEEQLRPDIIFTDIQMPGISGLELAVRLKELSPDTKIVFVTGYDQYAVNAYRLHAGGYVLKPVEPERIREEIDHLFPAAHPCPEKLQIRCFGRFEAFWKGEPLQFERHQTKELLAFLIDAKGSAVTAEEAISVLWETETDMKAAKHRIRNLIGDLRKTLQKIGREEVLIRRSGQCSIRTGMVDCDYYRMLEGDMEAVNSFRGEYMEQYSWAELTKGDLYFRQGAARD